MHWSDDGSTCTCRYWLIWFAHPCKVPLLGIYIAEDLRCLPSGEQLNKQADILQDPAGGRKGMCGQDKMFSRETVKGKSEVEAGEMIAHT